MAELTREQVEGMVRRFPCVGTDFESVNAWREHNALCDMALAYLDTRTAPAKGEVSRKLGNDTCDTHLRPVKGCKACTPKGTCPECGELETWENHLNGFQLGGYRCWPCHDKHEKSSKPAPTPGADRGIDWYAAYERMAHNRNELWAKLKAVEAALAQKEGK